MRGRIKNITKKELGYLIGLFIGDGYSNYNKNDRHYRVEFHLNSERDGDILNYINEILFKLKLNFFVRKDKRCNSIKTYLNSKEFMIFINEEVKKIKKKKLTKDYRLGLLSGFIDSEGSVKRGTITVTQKNKKIINFFKKILKQFDIEGKLYWSKGYARGTGVWRLRIPIRFKYLSHNSCKIERINSGKLSGVPSKP